MPDSSATRVAIVDDDPTYGRAVARLLRAAGMVARTFASAEEYLGADPADASDCLLLDVQLGGMSGFDLQDRIAASASRPAIVFISGVTEAWIQERAAGSGCAFVRKSDPGRFLIEAIARAVSGSPLPRSSPAGASGRPQTSG